MSEEDTRAKKRGCLGCMAKLFIGFAVLIAVGAYLDRKEKEAAWREALHDYKQTDQKVVRCKDYKESEEFEFFAPYAEREGWDADCGQAEKAMGEIASSFIDNDDAALAERIEGTIRKLEEAKSLIAKVANRQIHLKKLRNEAPDKVDAAGLQVGVTEEVIHRLNARIAEAKAEFPDRADAIDGLARSYPSLENAASDSRAALQAALAEKAKMETDAFVDYVKMAEAADRVYKIYYNTVSDANQSLRAKLDELYRSYSKTLADMKADYYLVIGRSTWDNDADYNTERAYTYPPKEVSPERYAYFTKLDPARELARLYWSDGRFRASAAVDLSQWLALGIDAGRGVSTRHDAGVFWLEDAPVKTYHKYRVTENGEIKTTDWVEVDEEDYGELYDYLGMAVVNKPYGFFEDETIRVAAPPGMAFVGMNRYGRWADDPASGESYWQWDDEYDDAFEIDIDIGKKHRYTRGNWRKWRSDYRGKQPYYGESEAGPPIFGTRGAWVRKDSRFQKSAFVAAGGLAATAGSFRGAGPARRGRGPSGFGK